MKIIQKHISLEPMTSRLPSVWPSYYNGILDEQGKNPKIFYFDSESLKDREWQYTSNWGMIPLNIVVKPLPNSFDEGDSPLNDRKPIFSSYTLVDFGKECSACCHCYGNYIDYNRYDDVSGSPTHFDDNEVPYYYDNFCDDERSFVEPIFTLSFERLSQWYHFFNEYYNLLKRYSHCNRVYTSAEDYYNYESLTKYADQMIYGIDKKTYIDLDKEFYDKGGRVEVLIFDKDTSEYKRMTPTEAHDEYKNEKTDKMGMVDVYDIGFFKWICENIVPSFIIPKKYNDYWKRDVLFYPDVIKWLAWFSGRTAYDEIADFEEGKDGEVESWDCKKEDIKDCCECEEYFKRGGKRIYSAMTEWYESIQDNLETNNRTISANTNCFIPTMILPTNLQISIDDLGEKSIFSDEYELGIDYRTAKYGDSDNTAIGNGKNEIGTVSSINGRSIGLFSSSTTNLGYKFDKTYMEKYASRCHDCEYEGVFSEYCPKCGSKNIEVIGWKDYTNYYINHPYEWNGDDVKYCYKNDFYVSAITYFAYDNENVRYVSNKSSLDDAKEDFKEQMSKKYPLKISDEGWILIGESLYQIKKSEYAEYDKTNKYLSNKKYMILRMPFTNTPYTYINGKQIFAEFYAPKKQFYFPFFKQESEVVSETCSGKTFNFNEYVHFKRDELNSERIMEYIDFNDNSYEVSGGTLEINYDEYYRISGYTVNNSGETLYLTYDGEIIGGEILSTISNAILRTDEKYFDGKPFIQIDYPFEIQPYKADEIKGRTVSKLSKLSLTNFLTDSIGNSIDGIYDINSTTYSHQPKEGSVLELIYQVGNTANISRFRKTAEDLDDIESGKNYFVGDIITRMTFYYKEYDDTIQSATTVDVTLESGDTYSIKVKGKYIDTEVTSGYTSLSAISASTSAKTELEEREDEVHIFYNNIFCDITYYLGATLVRNEKENYKLCHENGMCNHGVEYNETVQFVRENREYYLKKKVKKTSIIPKYRTIPIVHSISYPIYVYKMTQEMEHVDNSQYDSSYEVPMADFKFDINIFSGNSDTFSEKYSGDMETHNGLQVFPCFREEYKLGSSVIENITSDIYIDRGINAAFEKHLKLGEVNTLEALEQFGNNFFKIRNN